MAKGTGSAFKRKKKSFRDLDPIEQGGRAAREGFDYQDNVAVEKCLAMILDGGPVEVWCEAEDDIVQVWLIGQDEWFEFIQVKSNELGQAWTVAKLCERIAAASGSAGRCIAEKSLDHDRGKEKCRFRIITRWQPDDVLSPLKAEFGTDARIVNAEALKKAGAAVETKLGNYHSPNGNGLEFWANMTVWEVRASTVDVRNAALLTLQKFLDSKGLGLDNDQRQQLHDRLYMRVIDASMACGRTQKKEKRLTKPALDGWIREQARSILNPSAAGGSATLERKLVAASIPMSSIEAAKEQRRRYLNEIRSPKFLNVDDRDTVEIEALSRLHRLKTQLDATEIEDNGVQFLSRCQKELLELKKTLPVKAPPPDWFMFGYLYDVMNRCQHELVRTPA